MFSFIQRRSSPRQYRWQVQYAARLIIQYPEKIVKYCSISKEKEDQFWRDVRKEIRLLVNLKILNPKRRNENV